MIQGKKILDLIKTNLFFITAAFLIISFPLSESLLSIAAPLLFVQLFITGDLKSKWKLIRSDMSVVLFAGVYFIYLIGMLFCRDLPTGLYELKKTVFWLLVPFGVALSRQLTRKEFWWLLMIFVLSVTLATFISTFQIVFASRFNITDVRDASFVSHVAFALQITLSLFILAYSIIKKPLIFKHVNVFVLLLWIAWLGFFLILQKSLLGILSLYVACVVFGVWLIRITLANWLKAAIGVVLILWIFLPGVYVTNVYSKFYNVTDNPPADDVVLTENGNKYAFNLNNKQKENGHYVHWYICKEELKDAWALRSQLGLYDRDSTGYQIYYTLIRYMTSKGLKKDAKGIMSLTNEDVKNIEQGISNYLFVKERFSLYPRIYQTIWELDEYRNTGNPNNQSLSQRVEYVKAALHIIKNNFWGVGTGNYKLEFAKAYEEINTRLKKEFRFHVHNQYLSYMVKFGILGFIVILSMITYAIYRKRRKLGIIPICLIVVMIVSNFGEALMETHVGLPFFLFFIVLFLWHAPEELSQVPSESKN